MFSAQTFNLSTKFEGKDFILVQTVQFIWEKPRTRISGLIRMS